MPLVPQWSCAWVSPSGLIPILWSNDRLVRTTPGGGDDSPASPRETGTTSIKSNCTKNMALATRPSQQPPVLSAASTFGAVCGVPGCASSSAYRTGVGGEWVRMRANKVCVPKMGAWLGGYFGLGGGVHQITPRCPRMHWKGGSPPPPPSRAPSLCPATVPLTPASTFVTDSNRPQPLRQPPPTACLTASRTAFEVPSLPVHLCPHPPPA